MDPDREARTRLQAYRHDLVGRIVDDLAHEIRNPLHALVINLEVLKRRIAAGASDGAMERAVVIGEELDRVHRTVDRLITLIRPEPDGPPLCVPGALIEELRPLFDAQAQSARLALDLRIDDTATSVRVAPADLRFAVLALVGCAVAPPPVDRTLRIDVARDGGDLLVRVYGVTAAPDDERVGQAIEFGAAVVAAAGGTVSRDLEHGDGSILTLCLPVSP
jgi:two-component system C4-dicarboxylate transport sensor histidine kinase DctB